MSLQSRTTAFALRQHHSSLSVSKLFELGRCNKGRNNIFNINRTEYSTTINGEVNRRSMSNLFSVHPNRHMTLSRKSKQDNLLLSRQNVRYGRMLSSQQSTMKLSVDEDNDADKNVVDIGSASALVQENHDDMITSSHLYDITASSPYDDTDVVDSYQQSLLDTIGSKKMRLKKKETAEDVALAIKYLQTPKRSIDVHLPSITSSYSSSHHSQSVEINGKNQTDRLDTKKIFEKEIRDQRESFLLQYSSNNKELTKVQMDIVHRVLTYIGDHCAKLGTPEPLYIAWEKIKEIGMIPREKAMNAYLYVLTLSINTDNSLKDEGVKKYENNHSSDSIVDIINEVATFHDLMHRPTENTITLRIKCLTERGDATGARAILQSYRLASTDDCSDSNSEKLSGNCQLKMRTYLPILELYLRENNIDAVLDLYREMKQIPTVYFDANTYTMILVCLARNGRFRSNADIPGHGSKYGPELLNALSRDMAQDILEISSLNATSIRNAIIIGFGDWAKSSNLQEVPFDCELIPNNTPISDPNTLVSSRVKINPNSAQCPRTGIQLQLYTLSKDQKLQMYDTLLDMADTQFEIFDAKLESRSQKSKNEQFQKDFARKGLENFVTWFDSREGRPFTAIVDGANVAYYGLGNINYHQIKLVVSTLENMNEYPLVIMPQKYVNEKFYLGKGFVQELPKDQLDIIQDLTQKGQIYVVPQRCLDDYYWMLSSVARQSTSQSGKDVNNIENKSGTRPMLITNDQMRDHKLELLKPRLFRRWFESHIVNYHFTSLSASGEAQDEDVSFAMADNFSNEIQENICKMSGSDGTMVWHFPVSDWGKNDRFCLRIPHSVKGPKVRIN